MLVVLVMVEVAEVEGIPEDIRQLWWDDDDRRMAVVSLDHQRHLFGRSVFHLLMANKNNNSTRGDERR